MSTQQQILEAINKLLTGEITDMPAYIGQPPFSDSKADELYMLFYSIQSRMRGGTGGGARIEYVDIMTLRDIVISGQVVPGTFYFTEDNREEIGRTYVFTGRTTESVTTGWEASADLMVIVSNVVSY
ncbi:MAG: hypothetical protein K2X48_07630 [Chitinophagaceae bacterium]|nr:hypothetical protein [Chitinophagaceae bacterium]